MSDKPAVSPEATEAWQRWQMAAFELPAAANTQAAAASPASAPIDTPALLKKAQQLREAAQKRGHEEGYAAGHAQGLEAGRALGHEEGRRQGYEDGLAAGRAAGHEEAARQAQALNALAGSAASAIETLDAEIGQSLIALAVRIAEQVLRSTLDRQPEIIQDLVRDVLQVEAGKEAVLTLRVHPDDAELVRECLDDDPDARHWRLVADADIERGGCMVQTLLGNIDASLQTRWQRVVSALGHDIPLRRSA